MEKYSDDLFFRPQQKRRFNSYLFSVVAPKYHITTKALSLLNDKRWKRTLTEALPDDGKKQKISVLDIACGTGDITDLLKEKFPAASVTGIDLVPSMLCRAKENCSPDVSLCAQDMCKLAFKNESFDLVTGGYALRNAPDLNGALDEFWRILKPGATAHFLEFSKPPQKVLQFNQYCILKLWGALWGYILHRDCSVYTYIAESLRRYPDKVSLHLTFAKRGFKVLRSQLKFLGIIELLSLQKL
ncbi:class I SAM-dependent methyltransferase [Chitinispirillales bacterium ANBcel5]|uniref:class I SAM-dependent methyltransferase n=1 Tax=Cellulosispirillum alkaliphilum TaxID=3039283 RepID=UPI002A53C514|nr:class I SAM-dependent methyltransferase [Chitinispirillales bacterium ANBcel5]